jgi:hypothetical protein
MKSLSYTRLFCQPGLGTVIGLGLFDNVDRDRTETPAALPENGRPPGDLSELRTVSLS